MRKERARVFSVATGPRDGGNADGIGGADHSVLGSALFWRRPAVELDVDDVPAV